MGDRIVAGVSLSRRWRVVGAVAISTQDVFSAPPENDDFCQRGVEDIGNLSQLLRDTADEVEGSVLWECGAVNALQLAPVITQLG